MKYIQIGFSEYENPVFVSENGLDTNKLMSRFVLNEGGPKTRQQIIGEHAGYDRQPLFMSQIEGENECSDGERRVKTEMAYRASSGNN